MRLKEEWCRACGLTALIDRDRSAGACVKAVRDGAVLLITPDIAQKHGDGVPVTLFSRTAFLPTGAAGIAMLARAPIVPLFGRLAGSRQVLYAEPPYEVEPVSRTRADRQAAFQTALQRWSSHFERFVRGCPAAWFLWGDSRWTRVFRNDARYTRPVDVGSSAQTQQVSNKVGAST
jgi:lauroyl/myristoyl acyltransferase